MRDEDLEKINKKISVMSKKHNVPEWLIEDISEVFYMASEPTITLMKAAKNLQRQRGDSNKIFVEVTSGVIAQMLMRTADNTDEAIQVTKEIFEKIKMYDKMLVK